MTQAAVSYQIKLLEERLSVPLFLRKPRQIALSETGARLAPEVTKAFDILREAFAETREDVEGTLSISSVPTFASHWLAQNVGNFQLSHPNIAVRVESSAHLVDFATEQFDLCIRAAGAIPRGLVSHLLLKAEYAPLVSPLLVEEIGGVHKPADLLKLPLITPDDPWFFAWLKLVGVERQPEQKQSFSRLGSQNLEAAAAIAGRGIAMVTPAFFGDDIAAGRLMQPVDTIGWDGHGYYLVYPESRRNLPKIRAFRDWIVGATKPLRRDVLQPGSS